jgi:hypothetical protein
MLVEYGILSIIFTQKQEYYAGEVRTIIRTN